MHSLSEKPKGKVRWVSGLNQQFAKLPNGSFCSAGSTPALTATVFYRLVKNKKVAKTLMNREVAQAGSAPGLGPGGRRFESCLPDHLKKKPQRKLGFFFVLIVFLQNKFQIIFFYTQPNNL